MYDFTMSSELNPFLSFSEVKKVVINDGVTRIGNYAFDGCDHLAEIEIPNSVQSIGKAAFTNCFDLESIEIPEGVSRIEEKAFDSCMYMTSISIPSSVTSIGDGAFRGDYILTEVTIPSGVTSLGEMLFSDIETIPFEGKVIMLCKPPAEVTTALKNCTDIYYPAGRGWTETVRNNWSSTAMWREINKCGDNLSWTLENGTLTISGTGDMFDYDSGYSPWYGDSSIKKLVVGDGVTSIGNGAFKCSGIEDLDLGSGVKTIGDSSFELCTSLTDITIPANVTNIGSSAFLIGRFNITFEGDAPQIAADAFRESAAKAKYHCDNTTWNSTNLINYGYSTDWDKIHDIEHHEAKAATCNNDGNKEYWSCDNCDKLFLDEEGTSETTLAYVTISKNGHDYTETVVPPTCTAKGYTHRQCKNCDDCYNINYTDPPGHDKVHHEASAATCTEAGWDAYDTCSRCDYTTKVEIPKLNHEMTHHEAKAATCNNDGNKEYWSCDNCDKLFLDEEGTSETTLAYVTISKNGHDYTETVVPPTCTAKGYTHRQCKNCDDCYNINYTDPLGHNWGEWHSTRTSCESADVKTRECAVCHVTETEDIDASVHNFAGDYTIDQKAGVGINGSRSQHCQNEFCDVVSDSETIPAIDGNIYFEEGNWIYTGSEIKPEVTVKDVAQNEIDPSNYDLEYENNTNAGEATVKVTFKGDYYEGAISGTFTIAKADQPGLSIDTIKVRVKKTYTIDTTDLIGKVTFKSASKKKATVSSTGVVRGIAKGTTTITVKAEGDENHSAYEGQIKVIIPTVITKATLSKTSFAYDGTPKCPTIKYVNGSTKLRKKIGTAYEVEWPENAIEPGTYEVKITGIGNYDGTVTKTFKIVPASQSISISVPKIYVNHEGSDVDDEQLKPVAKSETGFAYKLYYSKYSKIATVDAETGMVHGIKAGTIYIVITANADEHYNKATKKVKVVILKKPQDERFDAAIAPEDNKMTVKTTEQINITGEPVGKVTYSTSSRTYATVSSTGLITAKKAGKPTISVKAAGNYEFAPCTKKIKLQIVK